MSVGLPYIRLIPPVTAVAGEALHLKCPVAGYPIEEIHWERNGRELPDDIRQKVHPDGMLVIDPVQKATDSGQYTCWARNKQGHSARRSGEVTVIGKNFFLKMMTRFYDMPIIWYRSMKCTKTAPRICRKCFLHPPIHNYINFFSPSSG